MNASKKLPFQNSDLPLVTVILPFYNTQKYLAMSIPSVLLQTYANIELLCIDDGSTDNCATIIREYQQQDPRVHLIQIDNHGQGYARNLAVQNANGKYLMFIDSDDYIEINTIEAAISKLEYDQSDFCVFNWYYDIPSKNTGWYLNKDPFFGRNCLEGEECMQLLQTNPIFMVNKIFRTEYFKENHILFSENHIYEDNPPWFKAILTARKVSILNELLYRVTARPTSSTQVDRESDWHCRSFLSAMSEAMVLFEEFSFKITEHAKYWILLYFYDKFSYYYYDRTPLKYKKYFLRNFVDLLHQFGPVQDFNERKIISLFLKCSIFQRKRYFLFESFLFFSAHLKIAFKRLLANRL